MTTLHTLTQWNRPERIVSRITARNAQLPERARRRKYAKMAESPYRFFRGTNHLFWADFCKDWRLGLFGGDPHTQTWLQGDAHVYNFGAFANHDGAVIYGMDDFDDAIVGDYQYDLWRLAISAVLDMRQNVALSEREQRGCVRAIAEAYLQALTRISADDRETTLHVTAETTHGPLAAFLKKTGAKKTRARQLRKWTQLVPGPDAGGEGDDADQAPQARRFMARPNKLVTLDAPEDADLKARLLAALEAYRHRLDRRACPDALFAVRDVGRRLGAGTGSLGVPRYYALIGPADVASSEHDRILDIKRQEAPEALAYMQADARTIYQGLFPHEGLRHEAAFRAIAEHTDRYLGWLTLDNDDGAVEAFSVRERSPLKDDFPTASLRTAQAYYDLAWQWGVILATEHKRGSRALYGEHPTQTFDAAVRARTRGRHVRFAALIEGLAFDYADCVEHDYLAFFDALGGDARGRDTR